MSRSEQLLIDEGYAALRCGDSSTARHLLGSASVSAEHGATIEGMAQAGYLEHEYLSAIQLWGSAYEAYRREKDGVGATRVARTLAYMYLSINGDRAVMQGWFARAVSITRRRGTVLCLAETTGDPCGCLREALSGFTKARAPMELA